MTARVTASNAGGETLLKAEGNMKGLCGTCKHAVYCTYKTGGAKNCDEFEGGLTVREHDWDLQALNGMFGAQKSEPGPEFCSE